MASDDKQKTEKIGKNEIKETKSSGVHPFLELLSLRFNFDKLVKHHGVDSQDASGNSALHHACSENNWQVIFQLVLCGANLDLPNNKGETPLTLMQSKMGISDYESAVFILACGCPKTFLNSDNSRIWNDMDRFNLHLLLYIVATRCFVELLPTDRGLIARLERALPLIAKNGRFPIEYLSMTSLKTMLHFVKRKDVQGLFRTSPGTAEYAAEKQLLLKMFGATQLSVIKTACVTTSTLERCLTEIVEGVESLYPQRSFPQPPVAPPASVAFRSSPSSSNSSVRVAAPSVAASSPAPQSQRKRKPGVEQDQPQGGGAKKAKVSIHKPR